MSISSLGCLHVLVPEIQRFSDHYKRNMLRHPNHFSIIDDNFGRMNYNLETNEYIEQQLLNQLNWVREWKQRYDLYFVVVV